MLFLALLCVYNATGNVADLKKWASEVVASEKLAAAELTCQWQPSGKVNNIFGVIDAAHKRSWTNDELEHIGAAMRLWDGPGGHDDLHSKHLRKYWTEKPRGARRIKKTEVLRRRSWQIVLVAELIKSCWAELRSALRLDGAEPAEVPTARDRLADQTARADELQLLVEQKDAELEKQTAAARRVQDAYRKAAKRNATKAEEKRAAVKAVREQMQQQLKQRIAEAKQVPSLLCSNPSLAKPASTFWLSARHLSREEPGI